MRRRIFIAINLPENVKKRLKEFREKFEYLPRSTPDGVRRGLPVRWTKEASLHLTLVFIGYVSDEQMLEVCRVSRKVAIEVEPFFVNFKKIILGPPGKAPRMIWVQSETSQTLTDLKNRLEDALLESDSGLTRKETRPMLPHLTLARLKAEKWHQIEPPPYINEEFQTQIPVNSIEVMESDLKHDGAEYMILESMPLGNN